MQSRLESLQPGELAGFAPDCRSGLLLFLVFVLVAVVSLDRYVTTNAVAHCKEATLYNLQELAQIRIVQDAQVVTGQSLRVTQVLAAELEASSAQNKTLATLASRLMRENQEMRASLEELKNIFRSSLLPGLPALDEPPPAESPPVDKET